MANATDMRLPFESTQKDIKDAINGIATALVNQNRHTIVNSSGTAMTDRAKLKFVGLAVADDSANGQTVVTANIPTKTSDLANDSGFITSTVNNLSNYYLKSQTYTQAEVDALISGIITLNIQVVQTLPTTGISTTTIYLVPSSDPQQENIYDEFINTNGTISGWEQIGSTAVDLSNYVTTSDLAAALSGYVQIEAGKGLSSNDYTTTEKNKLAGIEAGAQVNVPYVAGDGIKITSQTISLEYLSVINGMVNITYQT